MQVVSISESATAMAATLANTEMIKAHMAGAPGNWRAFPRWLQDGEDLIGTGNN